MLSTSTSNSFNSWDRILIKIISHTEVEDNVYADKSTITLTKLAYQILSFHG
mgnify:CR=1 FL=1